MKIHSVLHSVLAALAALWLCHARIGVDLSIQVGSSTWATYFSDDTLSTGFAILHAAFYNATINTPITSTIKSAWKYGIRDISLYTYPCIQSSPYAINNALECGTAYEQVDGLLGYFSKRNINFRKYNISVNTLIYDRNVPTWNTSASSNVTLQTLYINVEDNFPNYYFSYNHYENVNFLLEYALYAQEVYGIEVGFYTSYYDWLNIMTDDLHDQPVYFLNSSAYTTLNPFRHNKLWTPRYDAENSMDFYRSFAGWEEVYIKQTSGGSTDDRRTGSSRICTSYIRDATNATDAYIPISG